MTQLFAIDLGNKDVKMKKDIETTVSIPSRTINADLIKDNKFSTLVNPFREEKDVKKYHLLNGTHSYYFGKGINTLNQDDFVIESIGFGLGRYESADFKALLSIAIAELAYDMPEAQEGILEVNLVLGVPTGDFTKSIVKSLTKTAKKQHSVEVSDSSNKVRTINVKVKGLVILPQPWGTYYNLLLDDKGEIFQPDLMKMIVGIVDIGGGTILYDILHELEFDMKNRQQRETGIYTLYSRVYNALEEADFLNIPNVYQIEDIIKKGVKKGVYTYKPTQTTEADITDIVKAEIQSITSQVTSETRATFKDLAKLDIIAYTGGGAAIADRKLIKKTIPNAVFVENPEIANANGFFKFGLHHFK